MDLIVLGFHTGIEQSVERANERQCPRVALVQSPTIVFQSLRRLERIGNDA